MRIKHFLFVLMASIILNSCGSTQNISYFQDLQQGVPGEILNPIKITIKTDDKISIVISSKDSQLAELFNLPIVAHRVGQSQSPSLNQNQQISSYTVSSSGEIDFPVLGKIHVEGMTREEIASYIKNQLLSNNLIKDPVVTVEFANLSISVLGEVNTPGRYNIERDKITLLDALGMAGDLTIYGKRENVLVLRQTAGKQVPYKVNLNSGHDMYASPVYYLQQNDVVYVEPNKTRARQSTVNGNNVISTSFWLSVASLITTLTVLIVK
ncbi:polysaccharide biosynthesis/export family protein [Dysgonomonas mossii]|uniref:polysaccharide biosynthesis/export family protein n=1 Tax=Dysgonomonas mossii TaxID=163665 RepID=UPI00399163CA